MANFNKRTQYQLEMTRQRSVRAEVSFEGVDEKPQDCRNFMATLEASKDG